MNKIKTKTRVTLGVLGTIGIGILTNALWDVIKPATAFLYRFILNVSTLGITKYKDNLYQEIAKGYHESVSIEIYSLIMSVFVSMVIVAVLLLTKLLLKKTASNGGGAKMLNNFLSPSKSLSSKKILGLICFYILFISIVVFFNIVNIGYVNKSISHYQQMSTIVKPYISSEEILIIDSNFAQINNREDYEKIITSLEEIAVENNLNTPEFKFIF